MNQSKKIQIRNSNWNRPVNLSVLFALWMCFCSLSLVAENNEKMIVEGYAEASLLDSIPKTDDQIDTTRLKIGGLEIIIKDKNGDLEVYSHRSDDYDNDNHDHDNDRIRTRWFMLDVGFNSYLADGAFNLPSELSDFDLNYGKSLNINMHIFRQRIGIIGNNLNLMYGLEVAWNNYHFENDITLQHDVDEVTIVENNINFKRNKFSTTFLQMPVLFNIETNPRKPGKSFRVSAGGYGGLLLSARTKQKSSENGRVKIKDDFNLNKFRYGVIGQVGMGCVNFYVDYALNGLFKENVGPDLRPISIGFTLVPF